jgi:hypothetical protein
VIRILRMKSCPIPLLGEPSDMIGAAFSPTRSASFIAGQVRQTAIDASLPQGDAFVAPARMSSNSLRKAAKSALPQRSLTVMQLPSSFGR